MESIPNILADRYASEEMRDIWSARGKVIRERRFWIAVLKAQRDLGLDVPDGVIEAYEKVIDQVDLDDIRRREKITRHDVKARIDAFCALAGHEHIHKGMTSRDLTENVEQLQIREALELIRFKAVAALAALAERAEQWKDLVIVARTHNVAAQPTTFGRRLAMFGEDLLFAVDRVDRLVKNYPSRGLRGAVGTQLDALTLFDGDENKVSELENSIFEQFGVEQLTKVSGQVYPRSLDFEVVSALYQLTSGPGGFATTIRLMAGHELAGEGFGKGQVGSSAMPHKINCRSCERINGFGKIVNGYLTMVAGLAGSQWNEGDVSCSVVRRVALPDAFFAVDGMFETFITVLHQMEAYPSVIGEENRRYMPFLATTTVLMEAVRAGAGREAAHEAIKEHALAAVRDLREGKVARNDLFDRLAGDERLGLSSQALQAILDRSMRLTGNADAQVGDFLKAAGEWRERYPDAAAYRPASIL